MKTAMNKNTGQLTSISVNTMPLPSRKLVEITIDGVVIEVKQTVKGKIYTIEDDVKLKEVVSKIQSAFNQ